MTGVDGRVALVTGGGRGIGLATAELLASRGAKVMCVARSEQELVATGQHPFPETLQHALRKAALTPVDEPIENLGALDRQVGECFRDAANGLINRSGVDADGIAAIGSHGQTVRHQPEGLHPYSLQIGNPILGHKFHMTIDKSDITANTLILIVSQKPGHVAKSE